MNNDSEKNNYSGINRFVQSDAMQILFEKFDDGTYKDFIDDWKWIFSFSKKYWKIIVFYTVLGLVSSTLSLGASYISRVLINIITEKQFQNLWLLVTIMLASTAFSMVVGSVMSRISTKISIYVNNDIQATIFDQIIDSDWSELSRYQNGDLLHRFNSDIGAISSNAIGWIPGLVINIYTFIITFVVLVRMDVTMAFIAVFSAPVLLLVGRVIMRKMRQYRKKVLEMNSKMMSFEVETFYNFDTIKSFGVIDYYSKKLRWWQQKYKQFNLEYNMFHIKSNIMMTLLSTAVSMTAFFYCLYRLWTGQILYGDMTFFLGQRSALSGQFNSLVGTFPGMISSAISAHRVRELVELKKEVHDPESLEKMRETAADGIGVEMHQVTFGYRENAQIYNHSNFIANPGEIVAVLGPSGVGKTTMLRLILGMVHPEEGEVILRNAAGEPFPINADLRKLFSYVPQGNTVLSGTIAENMKMVREDATEEEMIEALKTACAWDFVQRLPDGINSTLGDAGRGISMGQGQRISIARALLRDCPIMMLDEATSALDVETEKQVLQNIIQKNPHRVCIVSTHRPSVLEQCSRIYRIDGQDFQELNGEETNQLIQRFREMQ